MGNRGRWSRIWHPFVTFDRLTKILPTFTKIEKCIFSTFLTKITELAATLSRWFSTRWTNISLGLGLLKALFQKGLGGAAIMVIPIDKCNPMIFSLDYCRESNGMANGWWQTMGEMTTVIQPIFPYLFYCSSPMIWIPLDSAWSLFVLSFTQ